MTVFRDKRRALLKTEMTASRSDDNRQQNSSELWSPAPSVLDFPVDRIDVWRVHLDRPADATSTTDPQACFLSLDETVRARRFHFEKDRRHFTRCRSSLRALLARYLDIPATGIEFDYHTGGKPFLTNRQNPKALQFNVSHSAGTALIAVTSKHPVGVDIEHIRTETDTTALAERFFSPRERTALRALPENLRVPGFFACWTRKEAFLKATGEGLSFPLAGFSVTTHPDLNPEIEEIRGNTDEAGRWFLADLRDLEGYRAALAIEHRHVRLKTYAWN